ncbi:transmembrane protein 138 [Aethina tumida]|uniref:transmembrane protein 138 n=1 Tax=Aethina tumida TaxID=116153 RepID=UPI00096ADE8E|nr:transmembrane protein 138 [Aethina tumida]
MKLTTGRYSIILAIQTLLFLVDFTINTFSVLSRQQNAIMLILFIVQDACLILSISAMLLTFFSTYVFQTGLLDLLYLRFRTTIIVCITYFVLTTILHIWTLILKWNNKSVQWPITFITFLIIQRLVSTIYYYYYKRAAFKISDPRFYEDIELDQKIQNNGQVN